MKNQVANTIYNQLGGRVFSIMTGTQLWVSGSDYAGFKVGSNAKKVQYMKVTLNGLDLYDVEFSRLNGKTLGLVKLSEVSNVYAEDLKQVFEHHTGMYTSIR